MSIAALLEEVRAADAVLWLDGDALRYRCAGTALPQALKARLMARRDDVVAHLKRDQATTAHPLSTLQQAYWLGEQSAFRFAAPALVHLVYRADDIDDGRLAGALAAVMRAHPPLRCRISAEGLPEPLADAMPPLTVIEGAPDRAPDACEAITAAAVLPPMEVGPLFAVAVVRGNGVTALHCVLRLIAFDAPAVGVFLADLAAAYADPQALDDGARPAYAGLAWPLQKREGDPERRARARAFWQARAATLPPPPHLPVNASAPAGVFRRCHGRLAPTPWQALCRRAAEARLSINAVLACVYADVLRRWSETARFSLTVMVSGRLMAPETAGRIGNYAGTLMLDCGADGGAFAARAAAVQEALALAMAHAEFDGVDALRALRAGQPEQAAMPLAPYVFSTQVGTPAPPPLPPALRLHPAASAMSTPQVWLDHQVYEVEGTLAFNFDHVDGVFPPGLIEQAADHYRALLEVLAEQPEAWTETAAAVLPPSCLDARRRANATARPVVPRLLHAALWEQAARRSDAPFLVAPDNTLTYGEMVAAVERLAARLRGTGVRPGDRVLVHGRKTPRTVVTLLAVLACGAAYVPAAPATPVERLLRIGRHAAVRVVAGDDPAALGVLRDGGLPVVDLNGPDDEAGEAGQGAGPATPDAVAYVIYTSGSTGQPKGVVITHRAAWNTIEDVNRRMALTARDRLFALSEFSFDLSVYDLFGAAAVGAAVVLPPTTAHPDPAAWLAQAAGQGVTVWNSVPAILDMAMAELEADATAPRPSALRLAMVSGDWVPLGLLSRLRAQVPECRLVALGGATEASIWSNWFPVEAVDPGWRSILYGWPLANQRFHVLDDLGRHRPPLVPGHLYISGDGLAEGYLDDPERTEAAFRVMPEVGERAYATGDMGRYLPDGSLEFLGRRDLQVKIHGHRVELGEVEKTLEADPAVARAIVLVDRAGGAGALVDRAGGAQALVAVIVWRHGGAGDALAREALLDRARRTLPPYMVPARVLDGIDLPLSANGKVDRAGLGARVAALRQTPAATATGEPDLTAAWTPAERRMGDIWAGVLGVPLAAPTTDFFAAGGDSLAALHLTHEINRAFGTSLRLEAVYQAPTVRALVGRLAAATTPAPADAVILAAGGPGGGRVCLFHPVGGAVLCYAPLARLLPPETAVVAIAAAAPVTVGLERLAADHAETVARHAAGQPVVLAGWSLGGMLALATARHLDAAGVAVRHVFAVDPWAAPGGAADPSAADLARAFVLDLAGVREAPAGAPGDGAEVAAVFAWGRAAGLVPAAVSDALLRQRFALFASLYHALLGHHPALPRAATTVYRATGQRRPLTGLVPLAEVVPVPTVDLPGDHYEVMRPPLLERIAADMAAVLRVGGR